ncbi:putative lipoprotein [Leptospira broomii serovar Hurstbridge str. 5399]|uniref:Lipoprotein n=1 Tax=Leptospira broomii serovar Hurstbridge str. 5399 TaxID=1049789 RepID=T0EZG8_9LEPT|nr:hypothetical protein [Leptospira broomii]EQA44285.1 putative lipoprotein [Leptospira broomii serovar Hurstbridge str. 5399]
MGKKNFILLLVLFSFLVGSISCTSGEVLIQPKLTGNEKVIRRVNGEACGFLGLAFTAYNFLPIMHNSRVDRAYSNALMQAPGAVALTNITIEESWTWILLGTLRCLKISGDAVQ